jgi:hypothetical protein
VGRSKEASSGSFSSARFQFSHKSLLANFLVPQIWPRRFKKRGDKYGHSISSESNGQTVTGCNQMSLSAWAEHAAGASALLQLRGIEQLSTPSGRRMFMQASSSLMISCIQRHRPLPNYVAEWAAETRKLLSAPALQ